jgi:hypothetical protein
MRITTVVIFLFFLFLINESYAVQVTPNINDTLFLKNAKYKKLNKFIGFHINKEGKYTTDPKLVYALKLVAIYHYGRHNYESVKKDKEITFKSRDINKFVRSDEFANRVGFDGIFKINSQMEFVLKPDLLRKMVVIPVKDDAGSLSLLRNKLKQQPFVNSLSLDTERNNPLARLMRNTKPSLYFKLKLKPKYWNIDSLKVISKQLNKWKELDKMEYTFEFFVGQNEQDNFFEINSKIPTNETIKKSKDPFKDFVDSLKKQ